MIQPQYIFSVARPELFHRLSIFAFQPQQFDRLWFPTIAVWLSVMLMIKLNDKLVMF
jgi:hypothetical protein